MKEKLYLSQGLYILVINMNDAFQIPWTIPGGDLYFLQEVNSKFTSDLKTIEEKTTSTHTPHTLHIGSPVSSSDEDERHSNHNLHECILLSNHANKTIIVVPSKIHWGLILCTVRKLVKHLSSSFCQYHLILELLISRYPYALKDLMVKRETPMCRNPSEGTQWNANPSFFQYNFNLKIKISINWTVLHHWVSWIQQS